MTMADTVAVMNEGVIEQMGPPPVVRVPKHGVRGQLPGQSTCFPGRSSNCPGDDLILEDIDGRYIMPKAASRTVWHHCRNGCWSVFGPKIAIGPIRRRRKLPRTATSWTATSLSMSFLGVSTQYEVRTRAGHDQCVLAEPGRATWSPRAPRFDCLAAHHGFVLSGGGTSTPVWIRPAMSVAAAIGDTMKDASGQEPPKADGSSRTCSWPGHALVGIFFVVPIASLFLTSLQTPVPGGQVGEFEQTFNFANYVNTLTDDTYYVPLIRSFVYSGAQPCWPWPSVYPLAYAIAFKSGKNRNLLLVMVIAPFFVSFILRTIAWRQILADRGFVVGIIPCDPSVWSG